jgi:iron complex transport system permease protein
MRHRLAALLGGLAVLLVATGLASATVGPVAVDLPTVALATANAIGVPVGVSLTSGGQVWGVTIPAPDIAYAYPFDFAVPETDETIVRGIRLPRIALAAVVGAALAAAGTVMQGFF